MESSSLPATAAAELGDFRIDAPIEIGALLRGLQQAQTRVSLLSADGTQVYASLRAVDSAHAALSFDVEANDPQLHLLLGTDEVSAVAYLANIRLQFELEGLLLVNGDDGAVLRCALPTAIYRFQRRQSFRVKPTTRTPQARLQHPLLPEQSLRLRVLDLSIGGLALLLPDDVTPPPIGTIWPAVQIELDRDTWFEVRLRLQHIGTGKTDGTQLGLAFEHIDAAALRDLQRYIDRTQKLNLMLRKP